MPEIDDTIPAIEERVERLICRCLDGQAGRNERAELAGILRRDPAARVLLEEYQRIDAMAAEALRRDLGMAPTPAASRAMRYRGVWGGLAGALLAAAAVVAFSFLPGSWSSDAPGTSDPAAPPAVVDAGAESPFTQPMVDQRGPLMTDYQWVDHRPTRRLRDVRRDLIGIRGENKNVIYIFERDRQATRIVPVAGDI